MTDGDVETIRIGELGTTAALEDAKQAKEKSKMLRWRESPVFFVIMASIYRNTTSGTRVDHRMGDDGFQCLMKTHDERRCLIYLAVTPEESVNFFLRASSLILMGTMTTDDLSVHISCQGHNPGTHASHKRPCLRLG